MQPTPRVLFVGNSLTYWKPGLDAIFRLWGHEAASVVQGGATLAVLWEAGKALAAIRTKQYDIIVLQDDLPEYGQQGATASFPAFFTHAKLFVEAARDSDATPLLLMTHSYERLRHTKRDAIARAHQRVAAALELNVAPSGLVIGYEGLLASSGAPKLGALLSRDREHPLPAGMLLAALVVRGALADAATAAAASAAPLSLEQLTALAARAIEAGALAGGAPLAPPNELAPMLASAAQAGARWWASYPTVPAPAEAGAGRGMAA